MAKALRLAGVLVLLEGCARLFTAFVPPRHYWAPCDAWGRARWAWNYARLRDPFVHLMEHGHIEYDPDLGWAPVPGLKNAPANDGPPVTTNSMGMRDAREFSRAKTPGRPRVLCVGDSFTFGEEAADDQTFPSRLQRLLPAAEVVNYGVPGYGHDQMLLRLERDGLALHPDFVLLTLVDLDDERDVRSFTESYAKPWFELSRGELELHGSPVPAPERFYRRWRWSSRFVDLCEIILAGVRGRREDPELTQAIVARMAESARRAGAGFFVLWANWKPDRVASALPPRWADFCRPHGLRCGSVDPFAHPPAAPRPDVSHWLPEENERVAEAAARLLGRRGP